MHQINFNIEEETSTLDYYGNNFSNNVSFYLSEYLPTQNRKEKHHLKNKLNEINYKSFFSKEFNKVFKKESNLKEEEENNNKINEIKENKINCFPFTEGIGIKKCLENLGYSVKFITYNKILLIDPKNPKPKKSDTKKRFNISYLSFDGKFKKRNSKKRRFKPDDIRKKIKTKFHKSIKNIINMRLKKSGSIKLFQFFPQNFMTNITINLNKLALNYTYDELIKTNIASDILKLDTRRQDLEKYRFNVDVLNYLDRNPLISKNSSFNIIRKMKYKDLFNAFIASKEFEDCIIELHQKKEKIEYIEKYVNKALSYVNFYLNKKTPIFVRKKNKKNNFNNDVLSEDDNQDEEGECVIDLNNDD